MNRLSNLRDLRHKILCANFCFMNDYSVKDWRSLTGWAVQKKEQLRRGIFRRFLKIVSVGANLMFCGRMFHSRHVVTGKARTGKCCLARTTEHYII